MLRFVELALFLSPLLLAVLWRVTVYAGWPTPRVVGLSAALLAMVAAALLWFHQQGALPTGTTYVPATLQNGRIVPGHGASQP